ncbi:GTP-binding protein [Marinicella gelatinilytica]|uniref:GTP-binding protein n=1 Tax=Marinicella gelatinilytica TaxID=2996017 RepID=UPI002260CABA|nr:ATP/GTP-binding protein [Marinicella gelatinilytica]MCX7544842.1 ATP/GTP-binding protein [Marinicella gelatinilytica]
MHKKLAFIGSVGSGKSTIIKNLSTIPVLDTDVDSSQDIGKVQTTVGIDYGHIPLDTDNSLGLYGVPGQRRFSLIWDFVKDGLWSVVILVKNRDQQSIDELRYLLEYFEINSEIPFIVAITHLDGRAGQKTSEKIKHILLDYGLNPPIYKIDPREKNNAQLIMDTLLAISEVIEGTHVRKNI